MRIREDRYEEKSYAVHPLAAVGISIVVSAIVTVLLLLLLAVLLYNTGISGTVSGILMVAIYVLGPFAGAFVLGKLVRKKRYLWGLLLGLIYFLIFLAISMLSISETEQSGVMPGVRDYLQVLLAVLPGGILGGMFS